MSQPVSSNQPFNQPLLITAQEMKKIKDSEQTARKVQLGFFCGAVLGGFCFTAYAIGKVVCIKTDDSSECPNESILVTGSFTAGCTAVGCVATCVRKYFQNKLKHINYDPS